MKGNGIERDTLDGVITALEKVQDTWQNGRNGLQYPDLRDAIYYLNEYRKLDSLDAVAFPEDDNPPLSWGELKQMEDKPVWLEADDGKYKRWFIVGNFFSWFEKEDFDAHVNLYRSGGAMEMSKETYGSYWQAYRKDRKCQ